ncbi:MAG: CCA tRNA nucleotidyltransferase [Elusimicrobia bacterium]|nr:CCA tRNA nucleotidyltransferase [Elusimicrobiota bacterium]
MKTQDALLRRLPPLWERRLRALGRRAQSRGQLLCLVGGCVRDLFLDVLPLDWDVVVQGPAETLVNEAAGQFRAKVVHHPAFLTYTLVFPDGTSLDVATARREAYPRPAALPVVKPASLPDDFSRRDFTVNAMALHLTPGLWGRLEDPFRGYQDLKKGLVRALHAKSFVDDPTRIFRAARYAGRYRWRVEVQTLKHILQSIRRRLPDRLSPARRRMELERTLTEEDPRAALRFLWKWGAWRFWSEEWKWGRFVERGLAPSFVKDERTVLPSEGFLFRLLVLCRSLPPESARTELALLEFPGALVHGVETALDVLARLERGDAGDLPAADLPSPAGTFVRHALSDPSRWVRWENSTPLLKGEDLKSLGYAPGPLYQEIFKSLRAARWQGRVRTRRGEERHVVDNFPRKKYDH